MEILKKIILFSVLQISITAIAGNKGLEKAKNDLYRFENTVILNKYACDERQLITFGNGMQTNEVEAKDNLRDLQKRTFPTIPNKIRNQVDYEIIYNPTFGFMPDLLESTGQTLTANVSQHFRWLASLDVLPDFIQEYYVDQAAAVDRVRVSNLPITQKHVSLYNSMLSKGRKIAAVPHSQGNLFMNESYLGINPSLIDGIGIVSTANPDDEVADGSYNHQFADTNGFTNQLGLPVTSPVNHINIDEDLIMRLARHNSHNPPGHNFDNYPFLDSFKLTLGGHGFSMHYLDTSANYNRTAAEVIVDETIERFDRTTAIKCRTPLLNIPNGENIGPSKVTDNGKSLGIAPYLSKFRDYSGHPSTPKSTGYIDWKGDYQNGVATKSISYLGPSARFVGVNGYSSFIYRDGQPFYAFPVFHYILGAALTTDHNGDEWVVAIVTEDEVTDTLYRRKVKKSNGMVVVDLNTSFVQDTDPAKANDPYWIKVAEFPHSSDSILYTGWFFNGDGTEAQTLRRNLESLPFWYEAPGDGCGTDKYCIATDQSDHDVEVLNRYKINIASDLTSATKTDLGFEVGDSSMVAVDYLDGQELILRTRNYSTHGRSGAPNHLSQPEIPVSDTHWLYLNGESLMDSRLLNCSHRTFFACLPTSDTFFSGLWNGLVGSWTGRKFNIQPYDYRQTRIHMYFMDLRTKTFELSRYTIDLDDDSSPQRKSDLISSDAEYFLISGNGNPIVINSYEIDSTDLERIGASSGASHYGREGSYKNRLLFNRHHAPVRGQYESVFNLSIAPPPEATGTVIEPDGNILISSKFKNGETFNFYSRENLELLTDADLSHSTVLPIILN